MIAAEVLHDIKMSGLIITVIEGGLLTVEPREKITEPLRANIRACKSDLIKLLSGENDQAPAAASRPVIPKPCTACMRLELIDIMGQPIAGCLYPATGEYPEGWRRLPEQLEKCIWN